MSTDAPRDPRLEQYGGGIGGALARLKVRVSQGDLGFLPVIIGLIIIWVVFGLTAENFLSAENITNLLLQIVAVGLIALGVVMVLLLGEIDLSVGAVSGLAAAVMAVLNVNDGMPGWLAIVCAILVGAAVGVFQGFFITKLKVPSFVVTLAGLLAFQGVLLYVLGSTGTINLDDSTIVDLANTFFDPVVGWIIGIGAVGIYALLVLNAWRRKRGMGIQQMPIGLVALRLAIVAAVVFVPLYIVNSDRGTPLAVLILMGFVILFDFIIRRTEFGRHVFAVGGNAEAARRAGISLVRIRMIVFIMCSSMAAVGGIMAASRLFAVNQASGSGDLLLNAIAAAVIGGTSLFGGRGSAWSALLGALVIGSISNGMDLLALDSSVKYMVTGAVLLVAVTIDATARRGRMAAGRA